MKRIKTFLLLLFLCLLCSACGKQLSKGTKFCPECGRKLATCPTCGADIPDGEKACSKCGAVVCPECGNNRDLSRLSGSELMIKEIRGY
jgi:predicted amidophosphoribosyltransferase